ncbi:MULTISPECIES: CD1375 family protein [Enterococcus]|uniref:CD1375 family protein n=2 Tax=Enterococcus TaxID=1350 RepID=A0AAW8TIE5_9ENTE|nr:MULTISPECIES: CD1375 family protein [Enterococcus]MDT2525326.1 CD1375 family protein [Enterococcus raffinosus]MDT2535929.1 CD1375 family protein [Enterococcus raffinosus]MDT2546495.1 CD1375 family protein [Enterococcus raffinosus]MDT2580382.1 CD1375 family protein [Enterococcus raffinosus]MDT2592633.1 CD1375 family protein [Enterococcus raffinosus]
MNRVFVSLIEKGEWSLENVPEKNRKEVEAILARKNKA